MLVKEHLGKIPGVATSFARLCVQIDINKLLPKCIKIGTFWQDIVYENVPILCY